MRKTILKLISVIIAIVISIGSTPLLINAQGYKPIAIIEIKEGLSQFTIDGFETSFPASSKVFSVGEVCYVPVRGLIEATGGEVTWNGNEKKVSISLSNSRIDFYIGNNNAYVNGKTVKIVDGTPIIQNNRSYIPLEFLVNSLNGSLEYRSSQYIIKLEKPLIQVIDATGRKVMVPKKIYRIVSLYPMLSQLLFTVKSQVFLVASAKGSVINYQNFEKVFPKGKYLPDASSFKDPNVETILSLRPDIVITTVGTPIKKLEEANIPVILLNLESPQLMLKSIQFLGNILHKEVEAYNSLIYINNKLNYIKEKTNIVRDKKTVYMAGSNLSMTFGGDFYQTYLIDLAGSVNVAKDLKGGKVSISYEQLIKWNPDYIILSSYCSDSENDILSDPKLKGLNAVKNKNVFKMPSFILAYDLPAPESILGIIWLSNKIYGDIFGLNYTEIAIEFYNTIFNYRLSTEDIKQISGES